MQLDRLVMSLTYASSTCSNLISRNVGIACSSEHPVHLISDTLLPKPVTVELRRPPLLDHVHPHHTKIEGLLP